MESADPWSHLYERNRARLEEILSVQITEVFRKNRVIEQRTGYSSEIARTMMLDVLAHLSTLSAAKDLDEHEQASQIAKIEEHLRRALVEHPEEVIRNRIGDVDTAWAKYEREAYPYREEGVLSGVPRHQELEEDRAAIDRLLESARNRKPEESSWDETVISAGEMTQAADRVRELGNKLEQCIGKAQQIRDERQRTATQVEREDARGVSERRRWAIGILVSILLAVGIFVAGLVIGKHHSRPTRSHSSENHVTRHHRARHSTLTSRS